VEVGIMVNILIVDCFDSFTYNLYHYLDSLHPDACSVVRYDKFDPLLASSYSHVVLSPGPGLPQDYPLINRLLEIKDPRQSVLGICLGHQCIGTHYKGKLERLKKVKHGLSGPINLTKKSLLFKGVKNKSLVGHYHSWVVSDDDFPARVLRVTSRSVDGYIMSMEHKTLPIYGLQFHPESIMTDCGMTLLKNWALPAI
jgi:anthranilate synthase/aminodeoxychorismate synthase-like glutamine amidotransferase